MSLEMLNLEKDLCRCCHSQGTYKSLYAPYFWLDFEEVVYYSKLQECFGVELAPVTQPSYQMLCSICDACIQKLQDAAKFKLQVQTCEKIFHEKYLKHIEYPFNVDIKKEIDDLDASVDNIVAGGSNGTVEDGVGCSKNCDNDQGPNNYEDENDFKWSDEDEMPLQVAKKEKDENTKKAPAKKKTKPPEEVIGVIEGIIQVVKARHQLLQGKDYTRVGDVFTCSTCEKSFKALEHFRIHFKRMHSNISRFSCPVCFEKFRNVTDFTNHKIEEHNIDDRLKCNACDKYFNSRRSFELHMKGFHKLGVKNKCDKCDFETYDALARHMQTHKTAKDYHCGYCAKSFKRKNTLSYHEKIHTGDKRKVCKECGQAFVQKASLNYHMSKYHPGVKF